MLFLLLGIAASLQQVQTGFLDRTITVAGRAYRYQVYVPADYQTKPTWPAILFLHGAGERGNDGLLRTNVGLGAAIRQNPSRYPAIVVLPQRSEEHTSELQSRPHLVCRLLLEK